MNTYLMKFVKSFVAFAACALVSLSAAANTADYGGYTWTYTAGGGTATITTGSYDSPAISPNPTGAVTIPMTLGGYEVKAIGNGAFYGTGLTRISSWGNVASIGKYAFFRCASLTSVSIPDAVTSVDLHAFGDCDNLTSLTIGSGVTTILQDFAAGCEKLANLTIGPNVTRIDGYAFASNPSLKFVTIPKKVTNLAAKAFNSCSNLKVAYVPIALKDKFTASDVFSGCAADFKVVYYGSETTGGYTWGYQLYDDGDQVVASVSPAPTGAVTIPAKLGGYDVTGVGAFLFQDDDGITSVTIPGTVTSIGESAFEGCAGLTTVTLPNSVTTIGADAFAGCSNLKLAYVPIALKGKFTISDVFGGCASGFLVAYYGSVTSGGYTWYYRFLGNSEVEIIEVAPSSTGSLSIPSSLGGYSVTGIGEGVFSGETGLGFVSIPNTVKTIGAGAFAGCTGITYVSFPDSVEMIGEEAFAGCTSMSAIVLNGCSSLTTIGPRAFLNCNTAYLSIPDSVTSIGDGAFAGNSNLVWARLPMSLRGAFDESVVFENCPKSMTIWYYGSAVSGGRTWYYRVKSDNSACALDADGKRAFDPDPEPGSTIEAPGVISGFTVTSVSSGAFRGSNIKSVILPDSVNYIDGAFGNCTDLESVVLPSALKAIDDYAFSGCSSLATFDVPATVTRIGAAAFRNCTSLATVTIPKSVTSIGQDAFDGCTSLSLVKVGRGDTERVSKMIKDSGFDVTGLVFEEDPTPYYVIRFHRNDASDEKTAAYDFDYGVETHLPSLAKLGWARRGCDFLGWATSRANADAGKVWKKDWALVSSPVAAGQALDVYAVWALKPGSYAIQFIRNDGAGTWRTVGFNYGEKTRMPSLANGLGWARRGYDFKGWALTTADANAGKVWKGDWAYVATPVKAGEVLTVYAVWALKPGYYQIRFNKNDGTGKWRTLGFECDKSTKLSTIAGLGWEREDCTFRGWASNKANADAGKVWKPDGEWVTNATAEGRTLSIYAIWEKK